jgi:hypothetical protein
VPSRRSGTFSACNRTLVSATVGTAAMDLPKRNCAGFVFRAIKS